MAVEIGAVISGSTIRHIVVVLHTETVELRIGSEDLPEVIPYRIANAPRKEISVDKAAISGATTVWVIAVEWATEVGSATVAIVAASAIAEVLATEAVSVIVVVLVIVAVSAIVAVSEIVAVPAIVAIVVASVIEAVALAIAGALPTVVE